MISVSHPTQSPLVVIAGGGTGGHLYPALAVANALCKRVENIRFVFFGSRRAIDSQILQNTGWELVPQALVRFDPAPWHWPKILQGLQRAARSCRSLFETDPPVLVVGTGGMSSFPAMCEAIRMRIPTALLNPDCKPGRANRLLAGAVDKIFVQWEASLSCFPEPQRVVVSGCPVRSSCWSASPQSGFEHFCLDPTKRTLLVTGASQGSRSINQAVLANLDFLAAQNNWQILHLTGPGDFDEVKKAYADRSMRAAVHAYTEHMGEAFAVSDLVISRAGASTLAELTALGLPSILMPYPYHKDRHQFANAHCLTNADAGPAAFLLEDKIDAEINGPALRDVLKSLMVDNQARLAMARSARSLGRRTAAEIIAGELCQMMHVRSNLNRTNSLEALCSVSR